MQQISDRISRVYSSGLEESVQKFLELLGKLNRAYLTDLEAKVLSLLELEIGVEWNGGTSFEPVQWAEMYAAIGWHCVTEYEFSTIKEEQAFWQSLAMQHPQRFKACFTDHKRVLALARKGQYHAKSNKESSYQDVKAAINSL